MMRQKYNLDWYYGLEHMLFPQVCRGCGYPLHNERDVICIACQFKLPRTNYHKFHFNPVYQKFWGRMPVEEAFSFLHFRKGNLVQTLLHALKYQGRQDVGERLGYTFGKEMAEAGFAGPDTIVPLPLHEAKMRVRGYNQCDSIVRGMNKALGLEPGTGLVERVVANATQTKKARFDRWVNVERIFTVPNNHKMYGRHVLLIDDVVTTGSTLESCGHACLEAGAKAVSIATLASA